MFGVPSTLANFEHDSASHVEVSKAKRLSPRPSYLLRYETIPFTPSIANEELWAMHLQYNIAKNTPYKKNLIPCCAKLRDALPRLCVQRGASTALLRHPG